MERAVGTFYASLPPHIKDDGWQRQRQPRQEASQKGLARFSLPGNKELVSVQLDTAVFPLIHSYFTPKKTSTTSQIILCYFDI